ncbi:hypothetical protein TTRE_0000876501 [Trichuris trichiura]|uniref:Uncharacterized protein n=1 Tax=Trichuris trichiura TaxID=36087 RepID=A0A077ZJ18_TRITR|nr:hypothetical protein TTRE_0000876501 [Trichuris trichiura]
MLPRPSNVGSVGLKELQLSLTSAQADGILVLLPVTCEKCSASACMAATVSSGDSDLARAVRHIAFCQKNEGGISEADVELYCERLQVLHDDFARRFHDILSLVIPDWLINPLTNLDDEEISLQQELLQLQSNVELKAGLSQGYQQLWLQKEIPDLYLDVWGVYRYEPSDEETQSAVPRSSPTTTGLFGRIRASQAALADFSKNSLQ